MHHFLFLAHWWLRESISSHTTISAGASVSLRAKTLALWCLVADMAVCKAAKSSLPVPLILVIKKNNAVYYNVDLIFVVLASHSYRSFLKSWQWTFIQGFTDSSNISIVVWQHSCVSFNNIVLTEFLVEIWENGDPLKIGQRGQSQKL